MSVRWFLRRLTQMPVREVFQRAFQVMEQGWYRVQGWRRAPPLPAPGRCAQFCESLASQVPAGWLSAEPAVFRRNGGWRWRVFTHADVDASLDDVWTTHGATYDLRPATVRFGPWINYRTDRFGDIREFWERCRLQWLVPLIDLEEHPGIAFANHLEAFLDAHPPLRGPAWVSGLEGAVRGTSVVLAMGVVERCLASDVPDPARAAAARIVSACDELVRLTRSPASSRNNHAMGECAARALFAWVFAKPAEVVTALVAEAADEFVHQTWPDGSGREAATEYWRFNIEWAVILRGLAGLAGTRLPAEFEARYGASVRVANQLHAPTFRRYVVGDSDDATVWSRHWPCRQFPTGGLPSPAGLPEETVLLESGIGLTVPADVQRAGLALRAGRFGYPSTAAHSHADQLSVYVYLNGRPIVIDPGSDRYFGPSERERLRGAPAHAAFRVEHHRQGLAAGRFLWTCCVPGFLGRTGGGPGAPLVGEWSDDRVRLTRRVTWDPARSGWVFEDSARGVGEHIVHWAWPLEADLEVVPDGSQEWRIVAGETNVALLQVNQMPFASEVTVEPVSPGYAAVQRGQCVRASFRGDCDLRWSLTAC